MEIAVTGMSHSKANPADLLLDDPIGFTMVFSGCRPRPPCIEGPRAVFFRWAKEQYREVFKFFLFSEAFLSDILMS